MVLRLLVIVLLGTLVPLPPCARAGEVPQEYQVKARYLLNIPLYSELPPHAMKGEGYSVCLIGETPLASVLEATRSKMLGSRPLAIRTVEEVGQLERCQVLFIASSERYRLQTLLPEAQRRGILTVSDMRNFTRLGGIIGLQTVDNRIVFDLNLSAAGKAAISFSSHLLKLARDVIR
jgi:hypothetical protein